MWFWFMEKFSTRRLTVIYFGIVKRFWVETWHLLLSTYVLDQYTSCPGPKCICFYTGLINWKGFKLQTILSCIFCLFAKGSLEAFILNANAGVICKKYGKILMSTKMCRICAALPENKNRRTLHYNVIKTFEVIKAATIFWSINADNREKEEKFNAIYNSFDVDETDKRLWQDNERIMVGNNVNLLCFCILYCIWLNFEENMAT